MFKQSLPSARGEILKVGKKKNTKKRVRQSGTGYFCVGYAFPAETPSLGQHAAGTG